MTVSTHVLDASAGTPASGVPVRIERREAAGGWAHLLSGETDADGRLRSPEPTARGVYRCTFGTQKYFSARGITTFYPEVTVTFEITSGDQHYHVPLLLSPFAYSTYRGS